MSTVPSSLTTHLQFLSEKMVEISIPAKLLVRWGGTDLGEILLFFYLFPPLTPLVNHDTEEM